MTYGEARPERITELVEQARSGSQEAFGDLVEHFWLDLVSLARAVLASDEGAEDVVQESLVHAWKRLWSLRKISSFGAWVRRIVVRRCLTRARRRRKTSEYWESLRAGGVQEAGAGHDVERLLGALPPRQRASVYLTWIEGYTDREIGSILGIRAATVRVHRHRGMEQLRKLVGEDRT